MKPLIFAEPGLLPFNPGRAGVQVPRSRGLDGPCPLWEPSLSAAVPGEPHGAPCSDRSPGNIKLCCRGVITWGGWSCCSVCLGENTAGEGQERREDSTAPRRDHPSAGQPRSPRPPLSSTSPVRPPPGRQGSSGPAAAALGTLPSRGPGKRWPDAEILVLPGLSRHLPQPAPAIPPVQPVGLAAAGEARPARPWLRGAEQGRGSSGAHTPPHTPPHTLPLGTSPG